MTVMSSGPLPCATCLPARDKQLILAIPPQLSGERRNMVTSSEARGTTCMNRGSRRDPRNIRTVALAITDGAARPVFVSSRSGNG